MKADRDCEQSNINLVKFLDAPSIVRHRAIQK
jgi:hypothetical protein